MAFLFMGLSACFVVVTIVCALTIVVGAFRQSVGKGLACVAIPPYLLFFGFRRWTYQRRTWITTTCLLSFCFAVGLNVLGGLQLAGAVQRSVDEQLEMQSEMIEKLRVEQLPARVQSTATR